MKKEKITFDLNQFKSNALVSNAGIKKENLYKNEIFDGMDESEKKRTRKKFRKLCENYCSSVISITDKEKLKELAKDFENFYTNVYRINDYTISSLLSQNAKDEKLSLFAKGLEKFKTILNK